MEDTRLKLLRLVNEKNTPYKDLTFENVIMGDPRPVTEETVPGLDFRNTAIQLTGILNEGYRGSVDVYYRRYDLTTLFEGESTPRFRDRNMDVVHILERLNNRYGLFLTLADFDGLAFGEFTDADLETVRSIELPVIDTSYGWTGTVTIELLYGNPLLESQVLVQLLPILTHPDELEELEDRRSGTVSTWAFDFTAWKEDLTINTSTGQWDNFARVQEIGRLAGLTYWYNGQVVDLPTEQVPGANPMFERVMVQTHAQGNVLGPIYFHYDANW